MKRYINILITFILGAIPVFVQTSNILPLSNKFFSDAGPSAAELCQKLKRK
jgi:hypothetical protein